MAYTEDVKRKLKNDYLRGMPLKAAAGNNDVPYETSRNWKRKARLAGDDWDMARTAKRISNSGVDNLIFEWIDDFVMMFQTTIQEMRDSKDIKPMLKAQAIAQLSDAYQKTIKAAGASNPKLSSYAIAMEVLTKLSDFIRENYPQFAPAFVEILEPFGEELSRYYG